MRMSIAKAKELGIVTGKATVPGPAVGMNKLEGRYAALLESRRLGGEIARWDFEPEKLRLADATFYSPDFRVILPDRTIEFHETKGFWRDDARVKIKVAARLHPYIFVAVRLVKGEWQYEFFGGHHGATA